MIAGPVPSVTTTNLRWLIYPGLPNHLPFMNII
ncbi:unnamed protein product [Nezara viridula]|uniref:Uncharacterized protein n=1 Tax=Nezara viridula TaxID=85310 RepID=A0A9P0E6N4_NEZVI|nr:unnamed protein product [Nezara viridula]